MVIGLDCAAPELVFDKYRDELPTFRELYRTGVYGELESCIPAITVPAWSSMMSSKDPGTLGIYGFRNRRDYSYDNMFIATGNYVKEPRVWDILSEAGKHVTLIGVPQTPDQPVNGTTIASLTPAGQCSPGRRRAQKVLDRRTTRWTCATSTPDRTGCPAI